MSIPPTMSQPYKAAYESLSAEDRAYVDCFTRSWDTSHYKNVGFNPDLNGIVAMLWKGQSPESIGAIEAQEYKHLSGASQKSIDILNVMHTTGINQLQQDFNAYRKRNGNQSKCVRPIA